MDLSVVYGRQIGDRPTTFGVTGFLHHNTFVLYDRETTSIWYPTDRETIVAVGGKRRGQKIHVLPGVKRMPLKDWLALHPDSKVLLGSKKRLDRLSKQHGS